LRWGLLNLFCPGWLRTTILQISASQVGRIIGVTHWHLTCGLFVM
jgi:hypothetical protein